MAGNSVAARSRRRRINVEQNMTDLSSLSADGKSLLACGGLAARLWPEVASLDAATGASTLPFEIAMADRNYKQPENVAGKYYVDTTCVPCHSCMDEAPGLLRYADGESHVYFCKQPENEEEEKAARFAMQACPTEAIGDDG